MSNFYKETKNPRTGKYEMAAWLDGHFKAREYAVKFPDGSIYNPDYTILKTREPSSKGDKSVA